MKDNIILRVGSHASGYLHTVSAPRTIEQIDAEIKRLHAINSASLPTTQGRDW